MSIVSGLETLLESVKDPDGLYVSRHDIAEAYSILTLNIRPQAHEILLSSIRRHSTELVHILRRDICRATTSPSSYPRRTLPQGSLTLNDDTKYTQDSTLVCHHALCFISDVFAFEPLYSLFSTNDLTSLLGDLLMITLAPSLPTPLARKTCMLIIWILQVQTLPTQVLASKRDEIVATLRRAINNEIGGRQTKLDAFQTVHVLLTQQPELFLVRLVDLLPSILSHLTSHSFDCRLYAALALNGFVSAKLHTLSVIGYPHSLMSSVVRNFVQAHSTTSIVSAADSCLHTVINGTFSTPRTSHPGNGPSWALVVLASLIILYDSALFSHAQMISLCKTTLEKFAAHRRSAIRALHPHIWKSLFWAFSRMQAQDISQESSVHRHGVDDNFRERVFLFIKQELRGGIGIDLAASLMGVRENTSHTGNGLDNVSKALEVVNDMTFGNDDNTSREGILLLFQLVGGISSSTPSSQTKEEPWDTSRFLSRQLVDGTILKASIDELPNAVYSMCDMQIDRVRALSEEEIVSHWDTLVTIWTGTVQKCLHESNLQISDDLSCIWKSLLVVQDRVIHERPNLVAPSVIVGRVASSISQFLISTEDVDAQVRQLSLVNALWTITEAVFSSPWITSTAEIILAAVFEGTFFLADDAVKRAWSQLCMNLVSVGVPTTLHIVSIPSQNRGEMEVKRQLWTVLARSWHNDNDGVSWEDLSGFLVVPFGAWVMTDFEIELWDITLRNAVTIAGRSSTRPTTVVKYLVERLGESKVKVLRTFPKQLAILLSYVSLADSDDLHIGLFSVVDDVLSFLYPPGPEVLAICLDIFSALGQIISLTSPLLIVHLLSMVQQSLSCWISDELAVLRENDYNRIMGSVYCGALNVLCHQEPSSLTLHALSVFFASAFGPRAICSSTLGPAAFHQFWRTTYHGLDQIRNSYPDSIKFCLKVLDDTFGSSFAAGLSLESDTQSTKNSDIPDSQFMHAAASQETQPQDSQLNITSAMASSSFNAVHKRDRSATPVQNHYPTPSFTGKSELFHRGHSPKPRTHQKHALNLGPLQWLQEYSSQLDQDEPRYLTHDDNASQQAWSPPTRPFLQQDDVHPSNITNNYTQHSARSPKRRKTGSAMYFENSSLVSMSADLLATPQKRKAVLSYNDVNLPQNAALNLSTPSSSEYESWEVEMSLDEGLQAELYGHDDRSTPATELDEYMDDPTLEIDMLNIVRSSHEMRSHGERKPTNDDLHILLPLNSNTQTKTTHAYTEESQLIGLQRNETTC